jgi:hypothetical protein
MWQDTLPFEINKRTSAPLGSDTKSNIKAPEGDEKSEATSNPFDCCQSYYTQEQNYGGNSE